MTHAVLGAMLLGFVTTRLPNGLEVSVLEAPASPIVATQLWYHVGSADEETGSRGLAHLFEHLMFGGTHHEDRRAYSAHHHRFGGYENAYTSPDETIYVSEIPPEGHHHVLEMEADRMNGLVVDEANLANEKRIVTEELRLRTENDPFSRLFVEAQRALLGDHPYAHDPSGTKEEIDAATVESARRFYERWYRPENAHLVVVGPVDASAVVEDAKRLFGELPRGDSKRQEAPALDSWRFPEHLDLRDDIPPVEIAIFGAPLPPAGSADDATLDVLTELLTAGEVDPVEEDLVRNRGKAVEAGVEIVRLRRGGALILYAASLPYRRETTAFRHLDEAREELGRMEWLTEDRLAAAKRNLRRVDLKRAWDADEMADAIGRAFWWEGDAHRAFDREQRIAGVTRGDVAAAIRKYVVEPEGTRVYVKPEHVPLYVTLFGWLYPVFSK